MATLLLKKSYQLSNLKEVTFKDLWGSRGVFTTMRMVGKPPKLILLKPHIDNLIKSSKKYGIKKKIINILETKIKPAVARDGGDIKFVEFKEGIVKVQLQGSCSGCPSSTITLKRGVQNLLTHYIPDVKQVEAI